jgi:hypothetical protein
LCAEVLALAEVGKDNDLACTRDLIYRRKLKFYMALILYCLWCEPAVFAMFNVDYA